MTEVKLVSLLAVSHGWSILHSQNTHHIRDIKRIHIGLIQLLLDPH